MRLSGKTHCTRTVCGWSFLLFPSSSSLFRLSSPEVICEPACWGHFHQTFTGHYPGTLPQPLIYEAGTTTRNKVTLIHSQGSELQRCFSWPWELYGSQITAVDEGALDCHVGRKPWFCPWPRASTTLPHPRPQPVPAALSSRKKTENIAQETQVAPPSTSQRTDRRTEGRASWGKEPRRGPWAWGGKAERGTLAAGTQHSTTRDCSNVSGWPLASDRHWGWSGSGEGNLKELTFQELGRRPPGWERTLHGYRHSRKY